MNKNPLTIKRDHLFSILKEYGSLVIAYSGGVDSSFLLAVANEALKKNLVAVTARSPVHPEWERQSATAFVRQLGVEHIIVQSREMSRLEFRSNTKDRCYFCKKYLCEDLLKIAGDRGIDHVAHGANVDDFDDFRPGFTAASEMGITAPLVDAGLTKNDIRRLSKQMNLNTWNKPSMACLATRIPYGIPITLKDLKMVEQGEQVLWGYGFTGCRVRKHGNVARIEVDTGDVQRFLDQEMRSAIVEKLRKIGFLHVAVDLEGYRQGSMNRDLSI
ncbi:MAG: ATP-dependent sacrificial sulfur transferase LarE [Deltaproteobacteria bacterium]|nr:ATP-dependent sacrificial sulfur transferase LarE [Deltaproteobacteria bacterium]MBW2669776.1 ATP-dependent sacrificial sulfur transferase LarE [Deltaproteobacteria bacterium]